MTGQEAAGITHDLARKVAARTLEQFLDDLELAVTVTGISREVLCVAMLLDVSVELLRCVDTFEIASQGKNDATVGTIEHLIGKMKEPGHVRIMKEKLKEVASKIRA